MRPGTPYNHSVPINCDPALYDYAPPAKQCPCFAAGKTPLSIFANFTGIQIGDPWNPGDAAPLNGIFELTQTVACQWQVMVGTIMISYNADAPASIVVFDTAPPMNIFFSAVGKPACTFSMDNDNVNPAVWKYYGGSVVLLSPLQDTIQSIQSVLTAINIDPTGDTFDLPRPLTGDETVHTIFRRSDNSNCHILYDHS